MFEKIFSELTEHSELDFREVKKDGFVISTKIRTKLIFNNLGLPNELFIICRDVTESKLAEQMLREREELYRAMFEKNMPVKFLIDPETGIINDANQAACEFYGYDYDSFRKKSLINITLTDEKVLLSDLQKAKHEENSYFIYKHKLSNGEERDVELYAGPLDFKGKTVLFCIVNDITDRRKAEAAIKASEQKYKNLAENAPIAVTRIFIEDQKYDFVNDEFIKPLATSHGVAIPRVLPAIARAAGRLWNGPNRRPLARLSASPSVAPR